MSDSQEILDKCDEIDAAIFSGDFLYDDFARKEFAKFVDRWKRTIVVHEEAQT